MKERTFYTFNLDVKRIAILLFILVVIIAYVFMLGRSFGKKSAASKDKENTTPITTEDKNNEKAKIKEGTNPQVNPVGNPDSSKTDEVKVPTDDSNTVHDKKELENSTVVTDEKSTVIEKAPTETKKTTKKKAKKVAKKKKASSYYFTLQLGAFSTVEGATKLKNSIINNNKIDDFPFIDRSGDFFVVRLGRKNTKEELDKIKASLEPALSEVARVKRISAK